MIEMQRQKWALLSNVQRTKVESKSQQTIFPEMEGICCYQMYKEQKLKANHNCKWILSVLLPVVIKCTKNKS